MIIQQLPLAAVQFSTIAPGQVFTTDPPPSMTIYLKTNLAPGTNGEVVTISDGAASTLAPDQSCYLVNGKFVEQL